MLALLFGQCIHFSVSSGVRSADRFAVGFAQACLVVRSACFRSLLQIDQPKGAAFGCSFWWRIQGRCVESSLRLLFLLLLLRCLRFIGAAPARFRCPFSADRADLLIGLPSARVRVVSGAMFGLFPVITTDRSTKGCGVWVFVLVEDSRALR